MKKILFWKPWVSGLVIGLVIAIGVPALAMTLTGSVDEIKALFGLDQSQGYTLSGNVDATGGVCSGGEPATTMCNVDINNLDVTTALAVDGTLTTSGAVTMSKSYDGFVVGNTNWTVATGTAKFVYTATADTMCSGDLSTFVASTTGAFTPSIVFSLGTSTSPVGYSVSLLASTTIATSSTVYVVPLTYAKNFLLRTGESIIGAISDSAQVAASTGSSTYFSLITIRPSIPCWQMGQ